MFRRLLFALGISTDPTPAPENLSASAIVANTVAGSHVAISDYVSIFIKLERHSTDIKARKKLYLPDKDGKRPVLLYYCAGHVLWYARSTPASDRRGMPDSLTERRTTSGRDGCFRVKSSSWKRCAQRTRILPQVPLLYR